MEDEYSYSKLVQMQRDAERRVREMHSRAMETVEFANSQLASQRHQGNPENQHEENNQARGYSVKNNNARQGLGAQAGKSTQLPLDLPNRGQYSARSQNGKSSAAHEPPPPNTHSGKETSSSSQNAQTARTPAQGHSDLSGSGRARNRRKQNMPAPVPPAEHPRHGSKGGFGFAGNLLHSLELEPDNLLLLGILFLLGNEECDETLMMALLYIFL